MNNILSAFLKKRVKHTLELKRQYKAVFDFEKTPVQTVMADLREFASPDLLEGLSSPIDPIALGVKIGREQVLKRIFEMLNISPEDINNAIIRGENNDANDEY